MSDTILQVFVIVVLLLLRFTCRKGVELEEKVGKTVVLQVNLLLLGTQTASFHKLSASFVSARSTEDF